MLFMALKFGSFTGYLPKGEHPITWDELVELCGFSAKRQALLLGLLQGATALRAAGATQLLIDGSFSTKCHNPNDYDCCYYIHEIDPSKLDPVFMDFSNEREKQKRKYLGEFFPAETAASLIPPEPYRTFFQHDKNGRPKGILVLELSTLP